ncbi:MAG: DUF3667 domain-containing protein [Flavobacterium sp.]|nr:MAG: DUF3667 domain-containing protein [Flavobacterium sp.]
MGKLVVRRDNTCLNCGAEVPEIYCSHCGQENVEVHKSFIHLFSHFIEDLTHYDSGFWKTIKYLLFRPARLTKLYLTGRRKSFVPPVKLYIFINFAAFFLLSSLPVSVDEKEPLSPQKEEHTNQYELDSGNRVTLGDYKSVKELDSVQHALPENDKLNVWEYRLEHRMAEINERMTPEQFTEHFGESFLHNLPKVLFLYLPIFAFTLWLFHGKKKWWYFDHAIFTLHYFSFLLLTFSFFIIAVCFANLISDDSGFVGVLIFGLLAWWFLYFFRSHRNMYGEKWRISTLKGLVLFIINVFLISIILVATIVYTAANLK